MQTESAFEAHRTSSAKGPSGLRRLSLAMLATGKMAEDFKGTEEGQGATRPGQVLAAFKAAVSARASCMRSIGCSPSPSRKTGVRAAARSFGRQPSSNAKRWALASVKPRRSTVTWSNSASW